MARYSAGVIIKTITGSMANIHVWDRTMEEEELRQKTSCSQTVEDQGSLVNHRCVDILSLILCHIYIYTYKISIHICKIKK